MPLKRVIKKWLQWNIENINSFYYNQMNQTLALNNPQGVDMQLNKPNLINIR